MNSGKTQMRKFIAISVISCLSIGGAFCAPTQQQQQQQQQGAPTTTSSATTNSQNGSSNKVTTTTNVAPATTSTTTQGKLSSEASISSGSPSLVNLRDSSLSSIASNNNNNEGMDTFDGKNPFADDSLWQIPIHLVRDLSAGQHNGNDNAKSALETPSALIEANDDDEGDESLNGANLPQSSSSNSPTIISASTDLKTAAGYHYPTHGHLHGHGHESAGHNGGSHYGGGDHYGGKYFQYASVPYPYSWDFGYRRGNPYHTIERYEHGKGPHFQTKVKWSDKHGGYGVHVWDYNHDDHHSHHYGGGNHYDSHAPSHYGGHHGGH